MMTSLVQRDGATLLNELMGWMSGTTQEPQIRVEEFDDDGRHVIRADLPGVDPRKDIDLTVEHGQLRLRCRREQVERDATRTEIRYGTFERVLPLAAGASGEDVAADYVDGVLTVTMPTARESEARRIPVSTPDVASDQAEPQA
jgi:HSP20 family molecular chaperone IbpA